MPTRVIATGKESLWVPCIHSKNITKPLRRPARVQLWGDLRAADVENGGRTTHHCNSWCCVRSCHVHLDLTRLDDRESRDAQGKLEVGHMIYLTLPTPCRPVVEHERQQYLGAKVCSIRGLALETKTHCMRSILDSNVGKFYDSHCPRVETMASICCSRWCQSMCLRWLKWTQEHKNHKGDTMVYPGLGQLVPCV
jgi:hypothetical protein